MSHGRERLRGLASMRRLQTAYELMQLKQAVNWWRTSFSWLVEVVKPLECC